MRRPIEKKAEFGAHRPPAMMLDEIAGAGGGCSELFGSQALPVFTPPWNRIAPAVVAGLAGRRPGGDLDLRAATAAKYAAPGLLQVNTHLDPIDWQDSADCSIRPLIAARDCRRVCRPAGRAAPTMRSPSDC